MKYDYPKFNPDIDFVKYKSSTLKTEIMTEVKEKKQRTPKDAEAIKKGALALTLEQRVHLRNILDESISLEVDNLKSMLAQAEKIANGNK